MILYQIGFFENGFSRINSGFCGFLCEKESHLSSFPDKWLSKKEVMVLRE
jgi:hypothetical protein